MPEYRSYGPAGDWWQLQTLTTDQKLWPMPIIEDLVFYDSPIVYIGQLKGEDTVHLVTEVAMNDEPPAIFPRDLESITHLLAFPSIEDLKATLHDGTIPTLESYRQATSIHRQKLNWTLRGSADPCHCSMNMAEVQLSEIDEAELPYRYLRPGNGVMEFTGANYAELRAACGRQYPWPLPTIQTLVFYDCPRVWVGETRALGRRTIYLHTMVDEKDGSELNYRLTFPDEATLRATLCEGMAPTRETFRQATKIVREELTVAKDPEHWTLKVQTLTLEEVPGPELPPERLQPCPAKEKAT